MTTVSFCQRLLASLMELFSVTYNVRRVHRSLLCLNYMLFPFVLYPPLLRRCVAIFAVAKGWLLLNIGWFVLFLVFSSNNLSYVTSFHETVAMSVECIKVDDDPPSALCLSPEYFCISRLAAVLMGNIMILTCSFPTLIQTIFDVYQNTK